MKNNFILSPGIVKKQFGSGSRFRGLLNPDSDFLPDPDSRNIEPKRWVSMISFKRSLTMADVSGQHKGHTAVLLNGDDLERKYW